MDRRQALTVLAAAAAGVTAGAGPAFLHSGRHGSAQAHPRRTPVPPPDPGYAPAARMKAVTSPVRTLHDLTPAAPANAVALTIDDGPHPYWTPKILDVLAEFEVRATFHVIGEQVPGNARLVQRIVTAGHQIADHTLTHPINLPALPAARIQQEIAETHDRIAQACSVAPRFFRSPGGAWSPQVLEIAAAHQMICVGWGVDPRDWARPGIPHITGSLEQAKAGDILLCHDGGGDRSQTVAALRTAIPALKQRGLTFVAL
ncbi:polysaccharide deacetylase family protein [Actinomadura fibrosa]|uniref:Polysaccharide deacetylase family protein n=1 Tax=Actinomadura fibrosa TaxID=111802 RepID=A0ABW2Y1Q0_9ACTN|nr:polysaccharide deacetylase family protein [Actinomadura fibrosa]